jgi:hypothetical protein
MAAVLTEIHLCGICSCHQEILDPNGRGQGARIATADLYSFVSKRCGGKVRV